MEIKLSQFCSMMLLIMLSCLLGLLEASCLDIALVDCWIIPLFGTIIGFPILLLYLYIYNYKKDMNLNQLIIHLFGKKIGKIIASIILLFTLSFGMITFWNLISFVASQYLYNTPQWFINIMFIIIICYFFSKTKYTIFRASLTLTYIVIFLYIISSLGLISKVNIENIKPILEYGITPVLKGVYNYIIYAILPIFILFIVAKNKIDNKNTNKGIIITYFLGNFMIFSIIFILIGVFGIELAQLYQYPIYHVLKRVFIGGFVERLENVLSIQSIIIMFIPCAFSNYYSLTSIKEIFNIKKNIYIYIFLILLMFLSQYLFKNNTLGEYFIVNIYPIFIGIFLIFIPLIIFIKILIQKIKKTS